MTRNIIRKITIPVFAMILVLESFLSYYTVNADESYDNYNDTTFCNSDGVELDLKLLDMDSCNLNVQVTNTSDENEELFLYFYENDKELTADISTWEEILNVPVNDININNGKRKAVLKSVNNEDYEISYNIADNCLICSIPSHTSGVFSLRLSGINKRYITIIPVWGTKDDMMPYEPAYINKIFLSDSVVSDKTFIAKYTFVSENLDKTTTFEDVFSTEEYVDNFTLYAELPVYIYDENTYMVKADAPYNNGYVTKDPYDVCFARCNYMGEILTDGIKWDNKTKTAYIDAKVLEDKKEDDFADMQMQLLLPCAGSSKTITNHLIINNDDELINTVQNSGNIKNKAYDMPVIHLATKDTIGNISRHEIGIYINDCPYPLNDNQYELSEEGDITINIPAALIDKIQIDIVRRETQLLKNCHDFEHKGWTASCFGDEQWAYLHPDVNMSDLMVGSKTDVLLFVDQQGNKVNFDWMWEYEHFDKKYDYGYVYPVCVPWKMFNRNMKFYRTMECKDSPLGVKSKYEEMHPLYNQPLAGYCTHIRSKVKVKKGLQQPGWVQLQNIDKTNKDYTAYIFTFQTKEAMVEGGSDGDQALANAFMYRQYHKKEEPVPTWLSVEKVWKDNNNVNRPESINVGLYWKKEGRPDSDYHLKGHCYKTAELNKKNNWYFKFTQDNCGSELVRKDEDGTYEWTIEEIGVPSGYSCSWTWEGNYSSGWKGVLTNTVNEVPPDSPKPPETGTHTGILMFITGMIFMVMQLLKGFKKRVV